MVTNETQEQLEARGWDFADEFIPDEPTSTMEYLNIGDSNISDEAKILLTSYAYLWRVFLDTPAVYVANVVTGFLAVAPDVLRDFMLAVQSIAIDFSATVTDLTNPSLTRTIQQVCEAGGVDLETLNAIPRATKEQFFDMSA